MLSLCCRSTTEKKSFHIIDHQSNILIENNQSFAALLRGTMHYLLTSLLSHKCSSFNIDVNLQSFSLRQLISVASSFVFQLRINCTGCMLWRNSISIAELAHLLVQDKNNRWTLAIDLSVYSRNQQFRCFDCVKIGKQNRLISFESLINASDQISSYTHTLLSSLITYSPTADALNILHLENSQFLIGHALINSTPVPMTYHSHYYHNIHPYVSNSAANSHPPPPQQRLQTPAQNDLTKIIHHQDASTLMSTPYHSFINEIITSDPDHHGFIRSVVAGSKNNGMMFFNIGGNYRYCTKKGAHHLRNTTALIINTRQQTFAIRCKDPECDNSILTWNEIKSLRRKE